MADTILEQIAKKIKTKLIELKTAGTASEVELADLLIRVMDVAHARGWDVAGALLAKMSFNRTRPVRHGGKLF